MNNVATGYHRADTPWISPDGGGHAHAWVAGGDAARCSSINLDHGILALYRSSSLMAGYRTGLSRQDFHRVPVTATFIAARLASLAATPVCNDLYLSRNEA